jgi:hypothetical protein
MQDEKSYTQQIPHNEHGQGHGYWIKIWSNGKLAFKGHYINGDPYGYWQTNYYRYTHVYPYSIESSKKEYYAR